MGIFDSVLGGGKKPKGDLVGTVIGMRQQGAPDAVIAQQMQMQGVPLPQIQDAISQADIKMRVSGPQGPPPGMGGQQMGSPQGGPEMMMGPPPMGPPGSEMGMMMQQQQQQQQGQPPMGQMGFDQFPQQQQQMGPSPDEIIERIIEEKWHNMQEKFDKFEESKSELFRQLQELRDSLNDLRVKYAQLQEDSVVKIEEYNKELEGVGSQIKAMQRIMQNMIPVFAENVRQLNDIVTEMKGSGNSPASPPRGLMPPAPPGDFQQSARPQQPQQFVSSNPNIRVTNSIMPGPIKKGPDFSSSEEPLFR
ncbi:MAG: hypothetical protein V1820_04535 [archaeon]